MSILNRPVTRAAYVVVLSKDDPSPLAPESDDEKEKKEAEKKKDKKDEAKDPPKVKVDLEDLDQRTLALPVPPKNYVGLLAGKAGTIFLVEGPAVVTLDDGPGEAARRRGPSTGSTWTSGRPRSWSRRPRSPCRTTARRCSTA